jgi:16S rRNA (guanine527-N7)-methyltransferase
MSSLSTNKALGQVATWAETRGIKLSNEQREQLNAFMATLLLWNRKISLMSQTDPETIAWKHFADCLFAARSCLPDDKVVDLGSGAGFPGLIMAIAHPSAEVCLIESRDRKASFLKEAVRNSGAKNAHVLWSRIELASKNLPEWATLAVSRALGEIDALQKLAEPLLAPGGRLMAMKTERFVRELRGVESGAFGIPEVVEYNVPNCGQRFLVTFKLAE